MKQVVGKLPKHFITLFELVSFSVSFDKVYNTKMIPLIDDIVWEIAFDWFFKFAQLLITQETILSTVKSLFV